MYSGIEFPGILSAQYDDDYVLSSSDYKVIGLEKEDNLVTILTESDPENNFKDFGRYLVSKGFTFKTKDADFFILTTDAVHVKFDWNYSMNITFMENLIHIRVKISAMSMGAAMVYGDVETVWIDWKHTASKSNGFYHTFQKFYPILKEYGYPIEFTRE